MSLLVLHRDGERPLLAQGTRLEHGAFTALREADAVLRAARESADALLQEADARIAAEAERAREDGFARGREEGLVGVLGALEVEARLRQLLVTRIGDVVEQCVRNMLGDLGDAEVFQRRVQHLLASNAGVGTAVLHVSPSQAHLARAAVEALAARTGSTLAWLEIYSDDRCARDTLVLESRVGFVDASIELTLQAARELLTRALDRATLSLGG